VVPPFGFEWIESSPWTNQALLHAREAKPSALHCGFCIKTRALGRLALEHFTVTTMNGNPSAAFQYLGRVSPE
jgi:hypothetical protein